MEQIEAIKKLTELFSKYPTIGNRSAERLAYATLNLPEAIRDQICEQFQKVKSLKRCNTCGMVYEDKCPICTDQRRDQSKILVVADLKDIYTIDNSGVYDGLYFALRGTISPLKNRLPEKIGIYDLKDRVLQHKINEVILALPTDLDGETTSIYIARIFEKYKDIKVTKMASGIPLGTSLEFLDKYTLTSAIKDRKEVKEDK